MATRIKNILRFVAVGPGATVQAAHLLNWNGRDVLPDVIAPSVGGFTIAATLTTISVTNDGAIAASIDVLVESWHSEERGFGAEGTTVLAPQPFVFPSGAAVGGVYTGMQMINVDGTLIDVFVDGVGGLNTNSGLSKSTALPTIAEVYRKFPVWAMGGARIRILLAGAGGAVLGFDAPTGVVTYTEPTIHIGFGGETFFGSYVYVGPNMARSVLTTGPSVVASDAVPAVAVGERTRFDFVGAAPAWTVNDLRGRFLRVRRAGTPVLFELPISENDADQLFVDTLNITGVVLNTDTYEIVEPAVLIVGDADNFGGFYNIGNGAAIGDLGFVTTHATFERCSLQQMTSTATGCTFDRCQFLVAAEVHGLRHGVINCAARDTGVIWCSTHQADTLVSRPEVGQISTVATVTLTVVGSLGSGLSVGLGGFSLENVISPGTFIAGDTVSAYGCIGEGLEVLGLSYFSTRGPLLGGGAGTNANTGWGIRVRNGGRARVQAGNRTLITGISGDLNIDGASVAYGAGVGQWEEVLGYNGNLTRKNEGTATAPIGDGGSRIWI